ncbi:GerAB/ArcD/ProY family transporter [Cohnella panacarvi]|uniref:GerAB/ArcD/ProY family transporter n=1 Tax=Cohnella panacarvi TaxID=400776 RepID=UPI00047E04C1|nr:endospore germination permease [Cohnella panacarvi]
MSQEQIPYQQITAFQATILLVHTITPTAMLVIPSIAIETADQNAWMSILAAWACGIGFILMYSRITRDNPGVPFLKFIEERLGRAVSVIVGILLAHYYFSTLSVIIRELIDFLSDAVLMRTPLLVIGGVAVAVAAYSAIHGLEVVARVGILVFGVSGFLFFLHILLLVDHLHFKYLAPIGEVSVNHIAGGSLPAIGWFSESSVLLLMAPYVSRQAAIRTIGLWGMSLSAMFLLITVIVAILVFGPSLPGMLAYPTAAVAETIDYDFVERMDVLFIFSWMATVYLKICVFFFGTVHCFRTVFRAKHRKPFYVAFGLLALLTALYTWESNVKLSEYQRYAIVPFKLSMNVVLPFMLLLALWIMKRLKPRAGG